MLLCTYSTPCCPGLRIGHTSCFVRASLTTPASEGCMSGHSTAQHSEMTAGWRDRLALVWANCDNVLLINLHKTQLQVCSAGICRLLTVALFRCPDIVHTACVTKELQRLLLCKGLLLDTGSPSSETCISQQEQSEPLLFSLFIPVKLQ